MAAWTSWALVGRATSPGHFMGGHRCEYLLGRERGRVTSEIMHAQCLLLLKDGSAEETSLLMMFRYSAII